MFAAMDLSKTKTSLLLQLLALLLAPVAVQALECILTDPPQTRTFDSFSEYRTNRRPFTPTGRGFEGNRVNFTFQCLDRLVTSMFKTYDSFHIVELNLKGKGIQGMDTAAFDGLSCLHYLDLSDNKIAEIAEGTFRGLGRLRQLNLSGNNISNVPPSSLEHFESLETLNLANNHIKSIADPFSFYNLSTLIVLNLNGNGMEEFPEGLNLLKNLKELRMASNKLNALTLWNLSNVSDTIEVLDIANNEIASINFTTNGSLTFAAMKTLDIRNNSLNTIDVHKMKTLFPSLKRLYIEDNAWECHVLSVVIHELEDSRIAYRGGNATAVVNTTKNGLDKIAQGLACRSGAVLYPSPSNDTRRLAVSVSTTPPDAGDDARRNWTSLGQTLRDLAAGNSANFRLTRDVMREVAGLQNVLLLITVLVTLCLVARMCVRAGACSRCGDYDRICGRNHGELFIDHDRDEARRMARRLRRQRERQGLLNAHVRTSAAYRAV